MYQNTQHLANSKRKEMIEFVCINSCITLSLPNRQEQQPATLLRYNSSSFPNKTKSKSRTKKGWRGMNNKGGMETWRTIASNSAWWTLRWNRKSGWGPRSPSPPHAAPPRHEAPTATVAVGSQRAAVGEAFTLLRHLYDLCLNWEAAEMDKLNWIYVWALQKQGSNIQNI